MPKKGENSPTHPDFDADMATTEWNTGARWLKMEGASFFFF